MWNKYLKQKLPSKEELTSNKYLRWLSGYFENKNLWRLHRIPVSRAIALGLFSAFVPIPLQMILVALLCIVFSANLPIAITLCWITNPITIPFIFYVTYQFGMLLLGQMNSLIEFELSMDWISQSINLIWWPLLLGSLVTGISLALIGYILSNRIWIWQTRRAWGKRKI